MQEPLKRLDVEMLQLREGEVRRLEQADLLLSLLDNGADINLTGYQLQTSGWENLAETSHLYSFETMEKFIPCVCGPHQALELLGMLADGPQAPGPRRIRSLALAYGYRASFGSAFILALEHAIKKNTEDRDDESEYEYEEYDDSENEHGDVKMAQKVDESPTAISSDAASRVHSLFCTAELALFYLLSVPASSPSLKMDDNTMMRSQDCSDSTEQKMTDDARGEATGIAARKLTCTAAIKAILASGDEHKEHLDANLLDWANWVVDQRLAQGNLNSPPPVTWKQTADSLAQSEHCATLTRSLADLLRQSDLQGLLRESRIDYITLAKSKTEQFVKMSEKEALSLLFNNSMHLNLMFPVQSILPILLFGVPFIDRVPILLSFVENSLILRGLENGNILTEELEKLDHEKSLTIFYKILEETDSAVSPGHYALIAMQLIRAIGTRMIDELFPSAFDSVMSALDALDPPASTDEELQGGDTDKAIRRELVEDRISNLFSFLERFTGLIRFLTTLDSRGLAVEADDRILKSQFPRDEIDHLIFHSLPSTFRFLHRALDELTHSASKLIERKQLLKTVFTTDHGGAHAERAIDIISLVSATTHLFLPPLSEVMEETDIAVPTDRAWSQLLSHSLAPEDKNSFGWQCHPLIAVAVEKILLTTPALPATHDLFVAQRGTSIKAHIIPQLYGCRVKFLGPGLFGLGCTSTSSISEFNNAVRECALNRSRFSSKRIDHYTFKEYEKCLVHQSKSGTNKPPKPSSIPKSASNVDVSESDMQVVSAGGGFDGCLKSLLIGDLLCRKSTSVPPSPMHPAAVSLWQLEQITIVGSSAPMMVQRTDGQDVFEDFINYDISPTTCDFSSKDQACAMHSSLSIYNRGLGMLFWDCIEQKRDKDSILELSKALAKSIEGLLMVVDNVAVGPNVTWSTDHGHILRQLLREAHIRSAIAEQTCITQDGRTAFLHENPLSSTYIEQIRGLGFASYPMLVASLRFGIGTE